MVGRGVALLFHDFGTRRERVVRSTPRPHFTPRKDPVPIVQEAGSGQISRRLRMEHPEPARYLSANLYDIYHCCAYSGKLLMMDRGTVRNM
jgi:hypothetical protein